MITLNAVKNTIKKYKSKLREKFSVKTIAVFGSCARGQMRGKSDIDILVEFKKPIGLFEFMDLEEYLGQLLGIKVDLVSKKALKPRIGQYILKEAVYI